MKSDDCFIEIAHKIIPKEGQGICGDVFFSRKLNEEGRTVSVLSDGLGSGIKANIMAALTASMALNYTIEHQSLARGAQSIKNTLPVDEDRKISYATFTITDIEFDYETTVLEYGNPPVLIFRGSRVLENINISAINKDISQYNFKANIEDRIIIFSDGVSQSGIGRAEMPFGWDTIDIVRFVSEILQKTPEISAENLVKKIIARALMNDSLAAQDDISCMVIYFRKPRNLLICSGPPYKKEKDKLMAQTVNQFQGSRIICGGTTAQIISRELKLKIETDLFSGSSEIPPVSYIKGIDLVTEGILTIGKVAEYLEKEMDSCDRNPAHEIIELILANDRVKFLIGTRVNEAHQDPSLPVELEIRRNVIKKIAKILEEKYFKEVDLVYL